MTITVESPFSALLAGPLDSQPADPLEAAIPTEDLADSGEAAPSSVAMWDRSVEDGRRSARDPREREKQQYIDDERLGRVEQARGLVATAPQSVVAYARLAQALLTSGEHDAAVDAARHAVDVASPINLDVPDHHAELASRFIAARVLAALGHGSEAEGILGALPASGPWQVLYAGLAANRDDTRLALARLEHSDSTEALAYRGFLLLELNQPQPALAQLRAAQRRGAAGPSLLLNLAYGFACVGSPDKAIRAAQHAVSLAPQSRHASFNLASYLRAAGRNDDAVTELRRLRTLIGEGDPQIAAALADAYAECGMYENALRELRRAQHHHDLSPSSSRLAELKANTAVLEWRLGQRDRAAVLRIIRAQIASVGVHLPLVMMLAGVSVRQEARSELGRHYEELLTTHSVDELRPLLVRLQLMGGELEAATRTAISYAADNPLDMDEVRGAIWLQGQVLGEYELAGEAGVKALRRAPGDYRLRNNVAFCLTLAGRARQAHDLLLGQSLDDPYLLATRGLVDFGLGDVVHGREWYDRAEQRASEVFGDPVDAANFVQLLRTQEVVALEQLGATNEARSLAESFKRPSNWREDYRYLILHHVASRVGEDWEKC